MIHDAVAAFVGCFAALFVIEESEPFKSRTLRYFAAFLVGILTTVALSWLLEFIVHSFNKAAG